jgi:hypothetical protein
MRGSWGIGGVRSKRRLGVRAMVTGTAGVKSPGWADSGQASRFGQKCSSVIRYVVASHAQCRAVEI